MYNILVTSTILWSSQLHACCEHDTFKAKKKVFQFYLVAFHAHTDETEITHNNVVEVTQVFLQ